MCFDHPTGTRSDVLYPLISDCIAEIAESQQLAENGGHGLVIIKGRYVLRSDVLRQVAGNLTFWFEPPSLDIAMVRSFQRSSLCPYA